MLIECDRCVMRDIACSDCVVTVLLSAPEPDGGLGDTPVELSRSGGKRPGPSPVTSSPAVPQGQCLVTAVPITVAVVTTVK